MTRNITDVFLNSLLSLMGKTIPEPIVEQAKMCLLDYYACIQYGSSMIHDDIEAYMNSCGWPKGHSELTGFEKTTSMQTAALLNGMMTHVTELDDGHRYGMLHPGAPVISALLAVADEIKLSEDQIIKGIVAGYEAAIRLASSVQIGHKIKGYHATGTCGTVGAALGIAFALDFTKPQIKTVLSAACSEAAGILALMDNVSSMKAYNVGRAAAAGINAAFIGRTSFCGPEDVIGGDRGFFSVMANDTTPDYLENGIAGKYAIETIYRKLYAACRHCHPPVEAVLQLRADNEINPEKVTRIIIKTYDSAIKGHDHIVIPGTSSAKMSMPYSVAAALLFGAAGHQQFSATNIDIIKTSGIMNKIHIEEDPEMSALVPGKRSAQVTIETAEDSYSKQVDYPKGEPENPVTQKELINKYFALTKAAEHGSTRKHLLCHVDAFLEKTVMGDL